MKELVDKAVMYYKTDKRHFFDSVIKRLYFLLPDKVYLSLRYRCQIGKWIDWKNPKSFNEKIQWLKLNDRREIYRIMVDKVMAKSYVEGIIGSHVIIPTFGVWNHFDEIDFDKLPDSFVLKTNHSGGSQAIVICKQKNLLDKDNAKRVLEKSLSLEGANKYSKEYQYQGIKKKILAEAYLVEESGFLTDYKLMVFNGKVKCIFTISSEDRFGDVGICVNFYDIEWNPMPFIRKYPRSKNETSKPKSLNLMIQYAERLAVGLPFVRIDFYEIKGKPYFGEMTLHPGSGFEKFYPEKWDYILGSWIKLN